MIQSFTGDWDLNIHPDLLHEILSLLGLKANIQASAVCKTWCEAAVSVRKLSSRPWLFYPQRGSQDGTYVLFDTLRCKTYKKKLPVPELRQPIICYSRDGWLLVIPNLCSPNLVFFNPFTRECINLPGRQGNVFAFSAAPTATSCCVISLEQRTSSLAIWTWCPGETQWTIHCFEEKQLPGCRWGKCIYSNDMFYCHSTSGHLGDFDPSRETWNILPVKPCHNNFGWAVLLMEHEGDIFAMSRRSKNKPLVFNLNHKRNEWEEKRELGGLTIFASFSTSLVRTGLTAEERNRILHYDGNGMYYYSLGDEESSQIPLSPYLSYRSAWLDPPQNNFNL